MGSKKGTWEKDTLMRLRRQYSKDETVAAMDKRLKEIELELGFVTSERDEAQYALKKLKETKSAPQLHAEQEVHSDKVWQLQQTKMKAVKKENVQLKRENKKLQGKNMQLLIKVMNPDFKSE